MRKASEAAKAATSLQQLRSELATFAKLLHRNRNQHRRTPYFRLLQQLHAEVSRWPLPQLFADANQAVTKPTRAKSEGALRSAEAAARGLARASQLSAVCIVQVDGLLAQGFFMPFALVMASMLATLRKLLRALGAELLVLTMQLKLQLMAVSPAR